MKFFCEYCGYRIDADKDQKCPNCGASYKKNKTFIRLEEERKKQLEENAKVPDTIAKTFLTVFFIIFAVIIIITAVVIIKIANAEKEVVSNQSDNTINTTTLEEASVTVGINEYGKTSNYQAKVTGYEVASSYKKPSEGYEFITFHLQVENLTSKELIHEDVNCIVDGVAQTNIMSSGYSTIPVFISSKLTVKGDATFEVPKDAKSYDIRYGDYITVHIEKE